MSQLTRVELAESRTVTAVMCYVDGMSLYFGGVGAMQGNDPSGEPLSIEPPNAKQYILDELERISKRDPRLKTLIDDLINSPYTHIIRVQTDSGNSTGGSSTTPVPEDPPNYSNGTGSGSIMKYNPFAERDKEMGPDTNATLVHELTHMMGHQ